MPNANKKLSAKTTLFVTLPLLFSAASFATTNPVSSGIVFTAKVSTVSCVKTEISNQKTIDAANAECRGGFKLTSVNYTNEHLNSGQELNVISFNI